MEDVGSILDQERSPGKVVTYLSILEKFKLKGSLVGYSLWELKESVTT